MKTAKKKRTMFLVNSRVSGHEQRFPVCIVNRSTRKEAITFLAKESGFLVYEAIDEIVWKNPSQIMDERKCELVELAVIG